MYLPISLLDCNVYLPIPGHPNHEVSLRGQVRHRTTKRVLATYINITGSRCYLGCSIGHIHRLLLTALTSRQLARTEYTRHVDGDTFNNTLFNLKLGSPRENARDRINSNTNGRVLRNQDVREIRALQGKLTRRQLAVRYNVSPGQIGAIQRGDRWSNLP